MPESAEVSSRVGPLVRWILSVAFAAAAALFGGSFLVVRGHLGLPLAATVFSLFLLLLPYFFFGLTDLPERLARWLDRRPGRLIAAAALLLVPYVIYAGGTGTFTLDRFARLAVLVLGPACVLALAARAPARLTWPDALTILALWLPLDFRVFRDVWAWPEGGGAYTMNVVLAVDLALLLFVAFRRLGGVGYRFRIGGNDLAAFGVNLAMCLVLAVPIALATGFVRFDPDTDPLGFVGSFVAIFLTIALPEELLFRGLIQNFLQKTWGRAGVALVVTSIGFGLAHLNNGPSPDWRYAMLATIAGFFYGRAYLQSGGLIAAALVHASIDAVWRGFF
jgi:membrane protease YdiL (CAAX protease family)